MQPEATATKTAKYQQVVEEVRKQIQRGELGPGCRLPSRAEMAARGVNHTTLDRAHRALEDEGLITRQHGRGTFVAERIQQSTARSKARSTGVVAFCGMNAMLTSSSMYWSQLVLGVNDVLQAHSLQLMLTDSTVADLWDKVDGAVLSPAAVRWTAAWQPDEIRRSVSLLMPNFADNLSNVTADDYTGQRQATQHLLDLGHRSIGMLHKPDNGYVASQRIAGYRHVLEGAGIEFQPRWLRPLYDTPVIDFRRTGRHNMAMWLRDDWNKLGCTALMVQNDEAAIGAMEALEAHGLHVPDDVSIMGFDGTELCEYARPRLTSVEVPLREMGRRATEILLRHIDGGAEAIEHITLGTRVQIRESTAPPSVR